MASRPLTTLLLCADCQERAERKLETSFFGAGKLAGVGHVLRAKSSGSLRGASKAGDPAAAVDRPKNASLVSRHPCDHGHQPCPCSFSSKSRRLAGTRIARTQESPHLSEGSAN